MHPFVKRGGEGRGARSLTHLLSPSRRNDDLDISSYTGMYAQSREWRKSGCVYLRVTPFQHEKRHDDNADLLLH